jgi:signal transduction histidine kinase
MISGSLQGRTRSAQPGDTFQSMNRIPERLRARAHDALVLAFAVAAVVETFVMHDMRHRPLVALISLGWSLPWLARRRWPFGVPLAICAALVLLALVAGQDADSLTLPFIAALGAAVSFGSLRDLRHAVAGWCAIIGAAAVFDHQTGGLTDFLWTTFIFSLAWVFGRALGSRTEQARELRLRVAEAERLRAEAAGQATAEERARIARELHDVVAHSVSVMVVQTSGVRRLLKEEQHREREALLSVEQIGRQALTEMRRMLGVMRTSGEQPAAALAPQPGLQHLDRLIAQVEEAGLPVTLRVEGERRGLSPGVDLSAYRIVQEGLTNVLKHSKGAHADVLVRFDDSAVRLEISDDGVVSSSNGAGDGHGLVGMRERVALYGGTLEAGPREGGGFVLRAELPVEAAR